MKRSRWLAVLMMITLMVIVGFQVYWLKDNYDREKKTMEIKAGVAFQETLERLQATRLRLPGIFIQKENLQGDGERLYLDTVRPRGNMGNRGLAKKKEFIRRTFTHLRDTANKETFIISIQADSNGLLKKSFPIRDSGKGQRVFIEQEFGKTINADAKRRQIVTLVNNMRTRLMDSTLADSIPKAIFFTQGAEKISGLDLPRKQRTGGQRMRTLDTANHALKMLYSVDSLQDSLSLPDLDKAYATSLSKQNLTIPFQLAKDTLEGKREGDLLAITLGFMHPFTYRLALGNTAPYLFRKLTLPFLFSLFLVGVTLFSFVLLYRNLLRQQRLAEIKNDFISNITHELKTPIATVGVAIEALKNFNAMHDQQKTKEYLDISSNELQRLGLLVDKVLKLSIFERKSADLNKETFNLEILIREVLDTMKLQFEKNKAAVNFTTSGNDFNIEADKLHITSVIYNLVDNALKYRNANPGIRLKLTATAEELRLEVADNGIGIAPEYRSRIFDKFFRVPTGNKHQVKGYGLGLSYVSHIIEEHRGEIQVQSELDKGSNFIIKLPRHG